MRELMYNGKPMKVQPIGPYTITDYARWIREGKAVAVELEPGDGTYYNLLIVPCHAPQLLGRLERFGIPITEAHQYLIVTYLKDDGGPTYVVPMFSVDHHMDDGRIHNSWTKRLIIWWLSNFCDCVENPNLLVID